MARSSTRSPTKYDRHRPTQLTRSLLARGLRVTAIEPGERLIARARDQLGNAGEVEFVNRRLEEAPLPHAPYSAAFSGSAIHWVDPDVSWRRTAEALVDGGTLALISYFGLEEAPSGGDDQALRAATVFGETEPAVEFARSGLDHGVQFTETMLGQWI